jgi:hypothetical protein
MNRMGVVLRFKQNGNEMFWQGPACRDTTPDVAKAHFFSSMDPKSDRDLKWIIPFIQHPGSEFEIFGSALHMDEPADLLQIHLTDAIFLELESTKVG